MPNGILSKPNTEFGSISDSTLGNGQDEQIGANLRSEAGKVDGT